MYYDVFEELCKIFKVRPSDVSKATGIATATLTSWKKGRYTPKADKLQKIAEFFNVSVDFFYENTKDDLEGVQKRRQMEEYYDDETLEMARALYENPDLRAFMKAAMEVNRSSIPTLTRLLYDLKGTNPDG